VFHPFLRVFKEEFREEIPYILAPLFVEVRLGCEYFLIKFVSVFGEERRQSMYKFVYD
jgi:hypothetical protein